MKYLTILILIITILSCTKSEVIEKCEREGQVLEAHRWEMVGGRAEPTLWVSRMSRDCSISPEEQKDKFKSTHQQLGITNTYYVWVD